VRAEERVVQRIACDRGLICFFDRLASLYRLVLLFIGAEPRIFAPKNPVCQLYRRGDFYISQNNAALEFRESAHRNAGMPAAGERADYLSLAAHAQNSTVLCEQHRVTRALAQLNDGLQ
jgi:hypothetical protein